MYGGTLVTNMPTLPARGWVASSFCGPNGGNCVEVNLAVPGLAGLRDSKSPAGPALVFDCRWWGGFLAALRDGQFDQ